MFTKKDVHIFVTRSFGFIIKCRQPHHNFKKRRPPDTSQARTRFLFVSKQEDA